MDELLIKSRKIATRVFQKEKLSVPIDIETLIKKYADWEAADIPYKGDAICVNKKERPLIFSAIDTPKSRLRFTLAHELGHIKIAWHTGMISCHVDNEQKIITNEYYEMEREANAFASELLMPRFWLEEQTKKNNDLNLSILIDTISSKACVSFIAALYAIIDVLPKGYVLLIQRSEWDYEQKLTSNDTDILYLNRIDNKQWLDSNSNKTGSMKRDYETIYWYQFDSNLCKEDIKRLFCKYTNGINLTEVFEVVFKEKMENPVMILPLIINELPIGYVISISFTDFQGVKYLKSDGTVLNPKWISDEKEITNWYYINSINNGEYKESRFIIQWWRFQIYAEFDEKVVADIPSKDIFRNIIDGYYYSQKEKNSVNGKVNGIIGHLKNRKDSLTKEQFYSMLKQKFIGRDDIEYIINHEDFDKFLIIKTIETYR